MSKAELKAANLIWLDTLPAGAPEHERVAAVRLGAERAPAVAPDRILRRAEAAAMLARTPRTVDRLVKLGCLKKVRFPGARRAAGFSLAAVQALVRGG